MKMNSIGNTASTKGGSILPEVDFQVDVEAEDRPESHHETLETLLFCARSQTTPPTDLSEIYLAVVPMVLSSVLKNVNDPFFEGMRRSADDDLEHEDLRWTVEQEIMLALADNVRCPPDILGCLLREAACWTEVCGQASDEELFWFLPFLEILVTTAVNRNTPQAALDDLAQHEYWGARRVAAEGGGAAVSRMLLGDADPAVREAAAIGLLQQTTELRDIEAALRELASTQPAKAEQILQLLLPGADRAGAALAAAAETIDRLLRNCWEDTIASLFFAVGDSMGGVLRRILVERRPLARE